MSFKKITYGQGEGRAKIEIEDVDGSRMGNWTIMLSDLGQWADMMIRKYGLEKRKTNKDRDLDWAR